MEAELYRVAYYSSQASNLIHRLTLTKRSRTDDSVKVQDFRIAQKPTPQVNQNPPLLKKLISKRKLLNTQQQLNLETQVPEEKIEKKPRVNFILQAQEEESDRKMKAAMKYLRNLGIKRRKVTESILKEEVIQPHDDGCSTGTIHKDLTLSEINNLENPINLNAEEQEYLDLTKEYRQYDEMRFKAFQKKCQEERRRSLRIERSALNNQIQISNTCHPQQISQQYKTKESNNHTNLILNIEEANKLGEQNCGGQDVTPNQIIYLQKPQTARNSGKKLELQVYENTMQTLVNKEIFKKNTQESMQSISSDYDIKSIASQYSLLTKLQTMKEISKATKKANIDTRNMSFRVKERPNLQAQQDGLDSEDKISSCAKSTYTRYVPQRISNKDMQKIQQLKDFKQNLLELSMSVEDASMLEEPKTMTARIGSRKQPSYNEFLANIRKNQPKKKIQSEKKKPPLGRELRTTTNKGLNIKQDSIKAIYFNLSALVNELDSSTDPVSNQAQIDEDSQSDSYGNGQRKKSKCISERNRNKYKLIDNNISSRDSTDSPTQEDRQSLQSENKRNLNIGTNKFTIILQQIDNSFLDDDQ